MASSLDSLTLKYQNRVQRFLENDEYYQYMLELIASGQTEVSQFNRVMDKKVDEKWLTAVEDTIPAIHEIIAHPRRFLKVTEEIAPVEKVKKITSSSIQHLSSHTQFISGMKGDTIYPGKLLTIENDESIDLYENRFVHTLIRKLSEFIEKRTGALFWDTGNEQASLLRMESTVEDDYEIIEYKLDMTVKSKQTYLENDTDKMDVFKRIDRVRRVVADFRQSAFVNTMSASPLVKSPIQRTNQITKDPNYRKCFELWQFLEKYDQVGYEVDVRETALDFDEDYLFQMYGNLALNYAVFKSLLERDQRRITAPPKRRKTVKPKFIKQIVEEFVDNYDLPDVEIRQVIIEEVTRAQVEIERRTAAQRQAQTAKEKEKEKARLAREKEKEKERLAKEKEREKEKAAAAAIKAKEQAAAAAAKEKEKAAALKAKEAEKARLAKEKEREKAKAAAAKEKEKAAALKAKEAEKARLAKEKEREKAKAAAAAAKAKEKAAALKAKEAEKARLAKEKEKEAAKLALEKQRENERLAKEKERVTAKAPAPKKAAVQAAATKTAAAPKPKAPPKPKVPKAEPPEAPIVESAAVSSVSQEPDAVPVPIAETSVESAPMAEPVPESEPVAQSVPEPASVAEPESELEPEAVPEPVPTPEPESEAVPEPAPTPEPELEAVPEPAPTPEPELEAVPEPAPTPAPPAGGGIIGWIRRRRGRNQS